MSNTTQTVKVYSLTSRVFPHALGVAGLATSIFDYPFLIGDEHEVVIELIYNENGTVGFTEKWNSDDTICKYYTKEFINMLIDEGEITADGVYLGGDLTQHLEEMNGSLTA